MYVCVASDSPRQTKIRPKYYSSKMRSSLRRLSLLLDLDTHRVSSKATVALIAFDAPTTRNALTAETGKRFKNIMADLKARDDVRCIVLTGKGAAFSAGGDAKFLADRIKDTYEGNVAVMREFYGYYLSIRDAGAPVVAAINGHAIGAGMCVSLACDIRVVNKDAKLSVNFSKLGIHPGMGATYFLPKLIGSSRASRLLITGETITGAEAASLGIASEALSETEVLPKALLIAKEIASNTSKIAVGELVKTLRLDDSTQLTAALQREAEAQAACYRQGTDLAEALLALKEKRNPIFH